MPVVDTPNGVVTLRVAYYGPPASGKTTNLEMLWPLIHGTESGRLTPRLVGENRVASLEIPAGTLGNLMGLSVAVRLETMQGEVSGVGGGWSRALSDVDGIVFVADSSPLARTANVKALAGLRQWLEGRGRSADGVPVVMQWNKRDRADARPIAELEMELNHRCFPSIEAASLRGRGITETLIAILKRTMSAAQRKAGGTALAEAELEHTVTTAIQWLSQSAQEASIARFGTTIETQSAAWPSVRETSRLDYDVEPTDPPFGMLEALERATSSLNDQDLTGLPHGLMAGLLAGCNRTRGSLLLFRRGTRRLDACEVVPAGSDPLNSPQPATGETTAAVLCSGREPVFLAEPTGTERLQGAWVVPVVFGSLTFGGMIVYVTESEQATTAAERAYWKTAAALAGVYLAWQAAGDRANGSRRARVAPGPEPIERLDV